MIKLTSIVLILFSISVYSQEVPNFGKMPEEYHEMTAYAQDSLAEAVVLFDKGRISLYYEVSEGWKMIFTRHVAIKIFTKEAYDWANQGILSYQDGGRSEKVKIKGITYNVENNKVVTSKLSKSSIFTEKTNEFWNTEKFTMPDVRVGSIIEFEYSIDSDFFFNLRTWEFQHSIPTMYSELTTSIPEYFRYRLLAQGYYQYFKDERNTSKGGYVINTNQRSGVNVSRTNFSKKAVTYDKMDRTLAARNIPAMRQEEFTSTIENYRMKVQFELESTRFPDSPKRDYRSTWETINTKLSKDQNFGKAMNQIGEIREELDQISKMNNDESKIEAVYRLIRTKIKWNYFYSIYAESNLNSAFKEGKGNIADINLALTGALREIGFESYPVLISTRKNGLINHAFPMTKQFNYVIALLKFRDKEFLLDASSNLPWGFIPQKCINGSGFIIAEDGGRWIDLSENVDFRIMHNADVRINNDGNIIADVSTEKVMYASFEDRSKILLDGEETRIKEIEESNNWDVSSYKVLNLTNRNEPLKESYAVVSSEKIEKAGNLLIVNPLLIGAQTENPFKLEKREYPVDFTYPRYYAYQGKITVPEGYQVDELPSSAGLALPERKGRFIYSITQDGDVITITSLVQIKKSLFLPTEYPFLKEFFSQIVEKQNEKIVFSKT